MDFHGFARKELQALCKQNKIPANMTNVAMANALSSLDHVEGLGEIMEQRSNKSVEVGTPEVPKTATRTLTRGRKPPVHMLESGGAVASSRARTSRKVGDGDLVKDEVKGVENTPAAASCRKIGGGAASSRKKVEVPSVQRVYSTRRSVRLVEKQLSELCLTDTVSRKRRPIKIDDELSSEITCDNIMGDQVKMEVLEECFEKAVKDVVNSSQESTQAVDPVVIAAQGSSALNDGVTDETRSDEVEKVIYEDCTATQIAMVNDSSGNKVTVDSLEEEEEKTIEGFANDVDSIDKIKNLDICMADAAAVDEVVKAKSEDIVNDAVDAEGNFEDGGKGVSKADEVSLEGVVKPISMDCTDVIGDMDNTAVGYESAGTADAVAKEDPRKDVLPGFSAVNTEKISPVKITEHEREVIQSEVIADHELELLIEKKWDFDLAANQECQFESVCKHDSKVQLEESLMSSSTESVQANTEATNIATEAITKNEYSSTFADSGFKVTSAMEPVVTKGGFSVKATSAVLGISPNLKGQLSAKKTVSKELPLVSENTNKENIASIIKFKAEESSKAPETPYEDMSIRKLTKKIKELTINQGTETTADANNLIAKQPRKALQTILANSRKQ